MKLIRPTIIDDAKFISGSIAETDYAPWDAGTTYALGSFAIQNHRIYKSSQAANLNHSPDVGDLAWWVDTGPTNRWSMFDQAVETKSVADSSISVTLKPGRFDSIALLNVSASQVTITVQIGTGDFPYDS